MTQVGESQSMPKIAARIRYMYKSVRLGIYTSCSIKCLLDIGDQTHGEGDDALLILMLVLSLHTMTPHRTYVWPVSILILLWGFWIFVCHFLTLQRYPGQAVLRQPTHNLSDLFAIEYRENCNSFHQLPPTHLSTYSQQLTFASKTRHPRGVLDPRSFTS